MKDFEDVGEAVEKWRDILLLNHCTVNVSSEQSEPPTLAEVSVYEANKSATIFLGSGFFDIDAVLQDRTLLHETIHIVTLPPAHAVQRIIGHLGRTEQYMIMEVVKYELEKVTEHFESVIYQLKEKAKKGKGK